MQAFAIPYSPHVDLLPSCAGWSIWAPTDLDWHLLSGLPASTRAYLGSADRVSEETLLAECQWAEESPE